VKLGEGGRLESFEYPSFLAVKRVEYQELFWLYFEVRDGRDIVDAFRLFISLPSCEIRVISFLPSLAKLIAPRKKIHHHTLLP